MMFSPKNTKTILTIEDNNEDYDIFLYALKQCNYSGKVVRFTNAEDALEALENQGLKELPWLIFLDLNLPGLSGLDFLSQVRQQAVLKLIPVLVLTTSKDCKDVLNAYEQYVNAYIHKPVDFHGYLKTIESALYFWDKVSIAANECIE